MTVLRGLRATPAPAPGVISTVDADIDEELDDDDLTQEVDESQNLASESTP